MSMPVEQGRLAPAESHGSPQEVDRSWGRDALRLSAIGIAYATLIFLKPYRPLWFDEIITYNIASAPKLADLFRFAHRFDLNPLPMDYLLTRASMRIFGDGAMAIRAPSIAAFYIASAMLFLYVRRKAGNSFAALAVIVLWYSPLFRYATEARPYALFGMFFCSLLLFWDMASVAERRTGAIWGVAASNVGLMTVHAFAPLSVLPFFVAEAWRYGSRRKPDFALWAALGLPFLLVILNLPSAAAHTPVIFPGKFQAAPRKIPIFFLHVFEDMGSGLFAALLAAILAPRMAWRARSIAIAGRRTPIRMTEVIVISVLALNPFLLILVLTPVHGPFWDRYCLTTTMAIYMALAIAVGRQLRFSALAGYLAAASLACVLLTERVILPGLHQAEIQTGGILKAVEPELPLVAASGLTFLEMDHYEQPGLVSRLYYLRDRPAAVQYAHATLFEDFVPFDLLKTDFHIRANAEQYSNFTRRYRQFLVFGTYDYPEDWLLRKLAADGASIVPIGSYNMPYKDHTLYKITLPGYRIEKP